ncbi:MAG: hypothetical protein AB7I19_03895 [Planctomycetota bacterium]
MSTLIPLTLGAAFLAAVPPHDPPARGPVDLLPETTIAFATFAGLDACKAAAASSPLVEMAERLVKEKMGATPGQIFAQEGIRELDRELSELGMDSRGLHAVLSRPLALGVGRPTVFENEMLPSFGLVVDLGENGQDASECLKRFIGMLEDKNSISGETVTMHGVDVRLLSHESRTGEVAYAEFDHFAVLSIGTGYLRDILAIAKTNAPSVRARSVATAAAASHQGNALLWGAVDLEPIDALVRRYIPYEFASLVESLGVAKIRGFSFSLSHEGGTSVDRFDALAEVDESGLLAAIGGGRVAAADLARLSPHSLLVAGMSTDTKALWNGLESIYRGLPKIVRSEFDREVHREVERELRHVGMNVREMRDLSTSIGPTAVIGVSLHPALIGIPQGIWIAQVRDGKNMADVLASIIESRGGELQEQNADGVLVRWLALERAPAGVSFAFTQVGDRLMISNDARYLRQCARGENGGLTPSSNVAVQNALDSQSHWIWLRLQDNIARLMERHLPMLENLLEANEDSPISAEDLPTAEELAAALRDVTVGMGVRRDGIGFRMTAPLGLGGVLAVFGTWFDEAVVGRRKTG